MGIEFEFFEAGCGDSILVSTDEGTNILIDGGEEGTYRESIESSLYDKDIDKLDLVVLTHIDNDHIFGLIEMLESQDGKDTINEIWFNSSENMRISNNTTGDVGFFEGDLFEDLINEYNITHRKDIFFTKDSSQQDREFYIKSDIKLTLLSPNKKDLDKLQVKWDNFRDIEPKDVSGESPFDNRDIDDIYVEFQSKVLKKSDGSKTLSSATNTSLANRSSIAFILEYQDKKFLFLGDADIKVINQSLLDLGIDELEVEFVKLSHHGSKNNINREFLDIVKTDTFVVLTDGTRHNHPHKETFSLILKHEKRADEVKLIFNYLQPIDYKFPIEKDEEMLYSFEALHKIDMEF
jgi:beta-lactamase superfamily II metal-dependent hydrolase